MGLFRNQIGRLLRNRWPNAQMLAEELFAILSSDEPIEIDSPIIITSTGGAPPLTLRNFGTDDSMIDFESSPPAAINLPEYPPFPPIDTGSYTLTTIYADGTIETGTNDRGEEEDPTLGSPPSQGGGGGGFPGQVVSGGPGDTYQVDVYEDGLSETPTQRSVRQLSIANDATIPAGTWALIGKVGSDYFMQVPVWLEDEA